jgi:hypothetical protein
MNEIPADDFKVDDRVRLTDLRQGIVYDGTVVRVETDRVLIRTDHNGLYWSNRGFVRKVER